MIDFLKLWALWSAALLAIMIGAFIVGGLAIMLVALLGPVMSIAFMVAVLGAVAAWMHL